MSKTKETFEIEMYSESLNSTDYYLMSKRSYEEEIFCKNLSETSELSEKSSIFVTLLSENTQGELEENKNNLINQDNEEDILRNSMGSMRR